MKERTRFFKKSAGFAPVASKPPTKNWGEKKSASFIPHFAWIGTFVKGIAGLVVKPIEFLLSHHLTRAGMRLALTSFKKTFWQFLSFFLLLTFYLFNVQVILRLPRLKFIPQGLSSKIQSVWSRFYIRAVSLLDKREQTSISRLDLIELSIRNMQAKKARSLITIGGMAIGIGVIVFLVSVGYGLEQLVVSRVARLDEMRQTDVTSQPGSKIKITDKTLNDFKGISQVSSALPLIAVVGRVSFQSSVSDTAVFGVTSDYLKQSAIKPVEGKIFDSNEIAMEVPHSTGGVLGVSTTAEEQTNSVVVVGEKIGSVSFAIPSGAWIRVREKADTASKILGYTKRSEGTQTGDEVWGTTYVDEAAGKAGKDKNGKWLGKWISAPVLLWKLQNCEKDKGDCEAGKYVVLRDTDGRQVQKSGYFAEANIKLNGSVTPKETQVLGVSTSSDQVASSSGSVGFIEIASESAIIQPQPPKTVSLSSSAKRQAIVNRAMLKILGIKESDAVGKVFQASFVATGELLTDKLDRLESSPADYTIVGVTPDEKTPIFFVPFIDLRSLGIVNYSQVKVIANDQGSLSKIRRQIEAMGYLSRSVADTVSQINSLFATARTILALLGTVALAVAALGMFNTLTVSLLERTREVGLMKAMGMKSSEVQELFLTESMVMGFFGGILGIILGFLAGKLLGVILSVFAVFRGVGIIDISYIPFSLVLIIISLSFLVGLVTGIYPARRAAKISALNALRYE